MRSPAALILLALALPLTAQTHRSIQTHPSTDPAFAVASWDIDTVKRFELRIHTNDGLNFSTSGSDRYWLQLVAGGSPQFSIRTMAGSTSVLTNSSYDAAPNGFASGSLAGKSDVRIRINRDIASGEIRVETWTGNCGGYAVDKKQGAQGTPAFTGEIRLLKNTRFAFVRVYSTTDYSGTCPRDIPATPGDAWNFPFESNSASSTTGAGTFSQTNDFVDSPYYDPIATIEAPGGRMPYFKVGDTSTLSGERSQAFRGNGEAASYLWEQIAAPPGGTLNLTNTTAAVVSVNPSIAGSYRVRLTVADSGGTTKVTETDLGAQVVTAAGVVALDDKPRWKTAFGGPLIFPGHEQWAWFRDANDKSIQALIPGWTQVFTPAPIASTCNVTGTLINDGRQWLEQPAWNCPGGDLATQLGVALNVDTPVWLIWDMDGDGSYRGRFYDYIRVTSPTTFTQSAYYWTNPARTGIKIAPFQLDAQAWRGWSSTAQPQTSWAYYDAPAGLAMLYAATNYKPYLDAMQQTLTNLLSMTNDYGYQPAPTPRAAGINSIIALAEVTGRTAEAYPAVYRYMLGNQPPATPASNPERIDAREFAFVFEAIGRMARLETDSTRRAQYCTWLANGWNNVVKIRKQNGVYWPTDLMFVNPGYPAKAPDGQPHGTNPWSSTGLTVIALWEAQRSFADSAACNNATVAAEILTDIRAASEFFATKAMHRSGKGAYYAILWRTSQDSRPLGANNWYSLNVVQGSNIVTKGASDPHADWAADFAPCDGTTYIGIGSATDTRRRVYPVSNCTANSVQISEPWPFPNESVNFGTRTVSADTNCGPYSTAAFCEPDNPSVNPRDLSGEPVYMFGTLCALEGNSPVPWCDRAKTWGGPAYGGPADGIAGTAPCHGPNCDGQTSFMACQVTSPGSDSCNRGKGYGLHAGKGHAQVGMAHLATFDAAAAGGGTPSRKHGRDVSSRVVPSGRVR